MADQPIDHAATLRRLQDTARHRIARDLASILQRACEMGIAICPDVDPDEGISYSVESARGHADVWWDQAAKQWQTEAHTVADGGDR